jgi:hypothetical protein
MKTMVRTSLAVLALGLVADAASAQLVGLPVNYGPAGAGVTVSGMFGRGLNENSGKLNSAGGMLTYGAEMFWVGAGASYVDFSELKKVSFGGNVGVNLPLGPELPVKVAAVAGASYFSPATDVNTLFIPAGVTLGINVPATGVAVTPWISPQFRYARASVNGVSGSTSSWGASGGVGITLPMGFGFDVVADYDGDSEAFMAGAGLHYTFKTGGGAM